MKFTKQQIGDLKNIMSVEEDMIPLLGLFKPKNRILDPWEKQFPKVFGRLGLKKGMTVLDIPCGQGGVSVPLAKKYGTNLIGYDIMPSFIRHAREYARDKKVSRLCKFEVADVRDVVKKKNICDVLLWIGPPHVWGRTGPTIRRLRNCVKNNGLIVIADAYLYPRVKPKGMYRDYENLTNTSKGYSSSGDKIIKLHDYKSRLWDFDYSRTRKEVLKGISRARGARNKQIVKRYLATLDAFERQETKDLGLAIWVIRVKKQ